MALVKRSHGVLTKVFRSTATVFINTCSSLMTDGAPAGQLVADSDPPVEVKPELLALSDDEAAAPALEQPLAKPKPSPSKGADMDVGLCRRKLSKVVWTVCPCARPLRKKTVNCFTQFRTETDVGALAALYIRLRRLAKADMDAEVLALMRRALPDLQQTRKRRVILDRPVCQHAFRKLLGLGAGRYSKLTRALTAGRVPLDGRCRPRADDGSNPVSSRKRSIVVEFLEELVHTVAEPMPEAAGKQKGVDGQELQPAAKFRRLRGRRPGQRFRRFPVVTDEQGKVPESQVMRLLPPGSFSDYHRLLLSKHPEVWSKDFGSRLGIRPKSQHAQCAVCVRHRRLLKRLANDARGRSAQMQRYMKHLGRQYRDRTFYWKSRASSRLTTLPDGSKTVCLITDAMDHSKFRFPRTALAASKEFSGFIRPTLDMSAVICHGHHVLLCCSLPHLKKDASWCCDLICHSLHLLGAKMDMREFEVICQSDNTSREVKNNVTARLFGTLVGLHKVKRMELRCLASGHSHEDVDQYFSAIGSEIERHQELATPDCFVQMLQAFHDREGGIRVHAMAAMLTHKKSRAFTLAPMASSVQHWRSDLVSEGVDLSQLQSRFWNKFGFSPSGDDVILRTKQYMSDPDWKGNPILYLPARICQAIRDAGAVPQVIGADRDFDDDAAANWLKYAAFMREEPFCMAKAAHYLERLARNQLDRGEPLEVSNCLPAPGPAMGHGFLAHDDAGVSFDPVPNNVSLVRENLPPVVLDRYRARRRNVHIYRAAVQLWGEGLSFDRALSIVTEAFDAATYEA
ncbi:unnamed protein product [Cladocopium goreaui]|uniref:DUF7869 domain-containing protein n=1 Tax=Cladocopium goreaui TaxID=2562237 RepID=A0A9P1G6R9_9DINO|nr:unnamed protein product [Cladocopium goreaui]